MTEFRQIVIALVALVILFAGAVVIQQQTAYAPEDTRFPETSSGDGGLAYDSGVRGQVLLEPNCPVLIENVPCPEKPYPTTIQIFLTEPRRIFDTVQTNSRGEFDVDLPPGDYIFAPQGVFPFPACGETPITVVPEVFEHIDLFCDSGIR